MKFHIENIGKISKADLELKDLTIICGQNSTNKTWLSYLICNVFQTNYSLAAFEENSDVVNNLAQEFTSKNKVSINYKSAKTEFKNRLIKSIIKSKNSLHEYFNVEKEVLKDLKISIDTSGIDESELDPLDWCSSDGISFEIKNNKIYIEKSKDYIEKNSDKDENKLTTDFILTFFVYLSVILDKFQYNKPYLASSERTGALAFQKELDRTTIAIDSFLSQVSKLDINKEAKSLLMSEFIEKLYINREGLSEPIKNNINDIRNAENIMKQKSSIFESHPEIIEILDELNGGSYTYEKDHIQYKEKNTKTSHKIISSSSAIKSLFLIDMYIRYKLKKDDILLIDEPELNLHPNNQRLMAKLIVRLVNAGVNVVITTHSDFLIREINNSIMLSGELIDKEEIMKRHNLLELDILNPDKVSSYTVTSKGDVTKMRVNHQGIDLNIFDQEIRSANTLQSDIYFNMVDEDE